MSTVDVPLIIRGQIIESGRSSRRTNIAKHQWTLRVKETP